MSFVRVDKYNLNLRKIEQDLKSLQSQINSYKIYTYYVKSYNPQDNTILVSDFQSLDSAKPGTPVNNPLSLAGISGKVFTFSQRKAQGFIALDQIQMIQQFVLELRQSLQKLLDKLIQALIQVEKHRTPIWVQPAEV